MKRKGSNKPKHLVAVYGTLREGLHNHHLIKDAERILTQRIQGFVMHSMGQFPAVRYGSEDSFITVEIYHINDSELKRCDALEGHPDWYERTVIGSLDIGDGEQALEMYVMPEESVRGKLIIQSGDWVHHCTKGE